MGMYNAVSAPPNQMDKAQQKGWVDITDHWYQLGIHMVGSHSFDERTGLVPSVSHYEHCRLKAVPPELRK